MENPKYLNYSLRLVITLNLKRAKSKYAELVCIATFALWKTTIPKSFV